MSPNPDNSTEVWYIAGYMASGNNVQGGRYSNKSCVRPVINLLKSAIPPKS